MIMRKVKHERERGAALVLALFALLLLSAIGAFMFLASSTETHIDNNYSSSLRAYYAARSGLEEIRDRARYSSTSTIGPGGLADLLPQAIAGNTGGVLYILNPANGEVVDPTDITSKYFDDQLCHDYNSGSIAGLKCTAVPGTAGWMSTQAALAPATGPLSYKWVRINMKTNRSADPYFVDSAAPPDAQVCWDGQSEQVSPGGASPACDANGMQQVYMLTSLAISQGTRKLLRAEIVGPAIRPPGAITMDVAGSTSSNPIPATFNNVLIPATSIDGRVHSLDGSLSAAPGCSNVAALAVNMPQGAASLQTGLNNLRYSIVTAANASCDAAGNSISPNTCTPPLAWVRGTGTDPRFVTTSTSTASPTPTPTPAPSPTPTSNSGHDLHDHSPTPTPTPTPTPVSANDCAASQPNCYRNLDLSAPQLNPNSLFIGNAGNSGDPAVYQSQSASVVVNEHQALLDYIAARKAANNNYFEVASTSLAASYGSLTQPAVVVITDSSLKLNTSLSGYGILVVPNDFEINAAFQWTGIVMVRSSSGQFLINSGAAGSINGALMLQAGNQFTLTTSSVGANLFKIAYSCEAIDLALGNQPLKVVSHTEASY